jgi:HEAT repeat protein
LAVGLSNSELKQRLDWLCDDDLRVRRAAALQLAGNDRALEALLRMLRNQRVRTTAARALGELGDLQTIGRMVLSDNCMTPQERAVTLETLRNCTQIDGEQRRYFLPDIPQFCQLCLSDSDAALQKGARAVLEYCKKHSALLRPAERYAEEEKRLLRPATDTDSTLSSKRLLRAAGSLEDIANGEKTNRSPLKQFFRRG